MRANPSPADFPTLPDETRAEIAAEIAALRAEVERILGKGTREASAVVAAIDDEVQNALIRGIENLHAFHRNGGSVRAWLGAIARNLRVDGARACRREEALFCHDERQIDIAPAPQRSPESLAILRDACRRVADVMDRVDPTSKRAFLLFNFEGLSYAEIGATLGLTEAAAKMRCVRVHEKLVEEVGEHVVDVLNDLRCRLPPMFFEDARAERRRIEQRRRTFEATQRGATACAMCVASMLAGVHTDIPTALAGLRAPIVNVSAIAAGSAGPSVRDDVATPPLQPAEPPTPRHSAASMPRAPSPPRVVKPRIDTHPSRSSRWHRTSG